jgi:NTP pyrophosphatase (non-canonical NTP hydrolase)
MTQTLTTNELRQIVETDHVQCGDAAAMARELLANREAQPVAVTDEMALAFHRALNDGGIGESDLEEIKAGLRGALCNITAPPAPVVPTPVNFSENSDADMCRAWAWERVKEMVTTDGWDAGDSANFFAFFCWGWDMRRQYNEQRPPAVPQDYFGALVEKARVSADKAMQKYPQPNYVLNKVAEESGEVIKAVIHYTEGREEWANVEGEIIDNLAMLIRLVIEGDQVIGFTPPDACRAAMLAAPEGGN